MIQSDITLDTLGYFCPMPIILTSKKIKELTMGQVLEVLSDDEGIKKDMPAWCQTTGHEWVGLEEEATDPKTVYKAYVRPTSKRPNSLSRITLSAYADFEPPRPKVFHLPRLVQLDFYHAKRWLNLALRTLSSIG